MDERKPEGALFTNSIQASLYVDNMRYGDQLSALNNQPIPRTNDPDSYLANVIPSKSCKYQYIIQYAVNNRRKKIYVYSWLQAGSGTMMLCRLLEAMGYVEVTGADALNKHVTKQPRFAFITHKTAPSTM